ncbi:MAG TPA: N-acetylmuramoyl-L-alanine amidase [Thermoclostridium caenicola]|uniref:N-acetylmuramoyl-L-alanine amidase n=1 Tax=Thermoclostridium caenicola TaxID=659425 RepID=A0A1M6BIY4_9FIRM|nr:N-acetylmuramoyl-L-alanine amidase [Thermoclostridium caenicola]SHI48453.1 N-acetylmuramoyl-L-alanine amidase [Thermoclostridium caenicola]HOK42886.1 N-acetylmuramoyl-L-alanine amidase [Thermoclostridium caenicola]HOL85042.1 N-acetylmuramoyl-L-alanine amidase [Thermoclostridium caenicola]HPO77184.1 N-acetylmuramoyl-L-alanine amidase [Thermoclostridium caenicola]
MILLIKRRNAVLVLLILFLSIAIFSLDGSGDPPALAANNQYKAMVILDPGHGGEDPGAVSNYSGIAEKDINLRIALMLKEYLEADNYRVIMTREEDVLNYKPGTKNITEKRRQDLTARRKLIDSSGADIVVSIHLNKFEEPQYYGAQTFYPPGSAESERLAVCVQNALRENVDPSNNRKALVKKERIVILRDLVVPTVLVECGFLSNSQEEALLRTVDYQEKIARAIKKGIDDYFAE